VCHVSAVAVEVTRDGWADDDVAVDVVVDGKSFLYNMVRIMVGTLVDVGTGRRPVSTVAEALRSRARGDAGITAPPHGLTLERVELAWPEGAGEPWPPIPRDR
jgi:tRNA pseudouridine38-40 synthase